MHWSKVLEEIGPDVFLIQETVEPREHLSAHFYEQAAGRIVWKKVEGRRWGSAVYAGRGEVKAIELPDFHGHVAGAEIGGIDWPDGNSRPLRVFSIHAPYRRGYARAVGAILDMLAENAEGGDLVIGGDFNLTVGVRRAEEARATNAADLEIQRRLREEFGLLNCWQATHNDVPLAQTLRWSSDGGAYPYHCDGLFVPKSWSAALRFCEVISSPEWDGLSDHNPVEARFRHG